MSDTKTSEVFNGDLKLKHPKWFAIRIDLKKSSIKSLGLFNLIWGTDIWINGWPILKILILANIIVWLVMFLTR